MVGGGYDHCFVIDRGRGASQSLCAWASSDKTGISMKVYTTQPGVQLYTGNFLQDCPAPGKGGVPMQKYGGFIPGIRPGQPTALYIDRIMTRITLAGAFFLAFVAILPNFIGWVTGIQGVYFGGTALLIVVGVAIDTMKQAESLVLNRQYQGFMK